MNDLKHDILIIGAGIVGLTSAISLHLKGFSVGIITNRPVNQKSSKTLSPVVYALNRPSEGFLKKLKLWDNLEAKDYDHVLIWDSFHKEEVLFSGTDCAEPNLGHIVEDQKLMLSCLKSIKQYKIPIYIDETLSAIKDSKTHKTIQAEKKTYSAKLIIGADGKQSWLREQLKLGYVADDYGQTALVGLIKHQSPHFNTARQRFLPNATIALLPTNDPFHSAMIWSLPSDEASELKKDNKKTFANHLETYWHGRMGKMSLESTLMNYELSSLHARKYGTPGAIILGDAAHVIHPLAGQGLNLGLADVMTLAEMAGQFDLSSKALLEAYTEKRHLDNIATLKAMDFFQLLFWPKHPLAVRMRAVGMRVLDALTPLKRQISLFALGYRPDVSFLESLLERLKK